MRLLVVLTLVACGGATPVPEYPSPPVEAEAGPVCNPAAPIQRTTMMLGASLRLEHTSCAGTETLDVSYGLGVLVGSTWLFQTQTLVEMSARETSRALPPVAEWVALPSDELGALQPLTDGWLYSPRAPTYPKTFVDRDLAAAPVLERVQAAFGEPQAPVFVIPAQGADYRGPWMFASFDEDPDVFGPRVLRAYLGPGDAWLDGFATFLWQYIQLREGSLTMDEYLESWLADYREHRLVDGQPHRQSALAARVKSLCMIPRLRESESRRIQHRLPENEPLWLDERGVLDVRECLSAVGMRLGMLRYEEATPEALLRVRSAPGNPPVVERGGSFFQRGDVIIEVNRRRVRSREDVAWALRDVDTGERFVIVVRRGEGEARTWARRPRVRDRDAAGFVLIPVEVDEP